jgi:hypothetical protein
MDKVWVVLSSASPFLAFYVWAGWWFITDAIRERRLTRAAVLDRDGRRGVVRRMDEAV